MEWAQVCGVNGAGGDGSGYLIAPDLVLTSGHVVHAPGTEATVFRPGRAGSVTGTVVWNGHDVALVRVTGMGPATVRWGRTITHHPGIPCACWGVPDLVQRDGQPVDVAQVTGHLNPGDRKVAGRYVMHLDGHPPTGASPWAGMSGAALFCGDLLTGVIAVDPAWRAHAALEAVPVEVLLRDPDFRELVSGRCSGVEVQDLTDPHAHRDTPVASPAGLLVASSAVVPFQGRADELDRLHQWAEQPGPGVWLLHGPGGQGKTRLAQQFGDRLADDGWEVVWLRPGVDPTPFADVVVPLLVVVDYAEGRVDQVADLLGGHAKVLLLARTAGEWWGQLAGAHDRAADLVDAAEVHRLPPLGEQDLYRSAVKAFAAALPGVSGMAGTDWAAAADRLDGTADPGDTVLSVHTTALADLLDAESTQDGGRTRGPEDRLLDHERRHWRTTAQARGLLPGLTMATLTDAVAAVVLLGPPGRRDALDFLARVPGLADQPRDRRDAVRAWLAGLYPAPDRSTAFDALQPDRLAERLIGRLVLDDERVNIVEELVPQVDFAEAVSLLVVCARAANHADVGEAVAESVVQWCVDHPETLAEPALAVATRVESPQALLAALDRLVTDDATDPEVLRGMGNAIPDHTEVLADLAVPIARRLVAIYRHYGANEALAAGLGGLSDRLQDTGSSDEALAAAQESLDLFRALVAERPDLVDDLVLALRRVAMALARQGRLTNALAAITEATDLTRELAARDPGTYDAEHALNLNNLSIALVDLRRTEESMAPLTEATAVYRRLAEATPAYRPPLAMVLHNLANRHHLLGHVDEAVAAAVESVAIRRDLADRNPDAYLPDLAIGLNTLGLILGEAGRTEDALAVAEEAVALYRRLVEARPVATHLNDLARTLHNLGLHLDRLARPDEAAAAVVEAVEIRRLLVEHVPESIRLRADLAHSLTLFGGLLHEAGRFAGELPVVTECLQLRFGLMFSEPAVHTRDVMDASLAYKECAAELGLGERADAAVRRVGTLGRELMEGHDVLDELNEALLALALRDG